MESWTIDFVYLAFYNPSEKLESIFTLGYNIFELCKEVDNLRTLACRQLSHKNQNIIIFVWGFQYQLLPMVGLGFGSYFEIS